jgi:NTE family protein
MSFALVLSGGGTSAVAWEIGVLKGLRDAGVDLTVADLIVGTSAGAIVGTNIALGRDLEELLTEQLLPPETNAGRDVSALMRARAALERGGDAPRAGLEPAMLVKLGELALRAPTESAESRLATVRSYLPPGPAWPERDLLITALDIATGTLVIWNKDTEASLLEAVASSCAAPMIAPPTTIGGHRYMDAGPRSGTNAQLAARHGLVVVLAVARPGPLGPLESEASDLRAGGSRVELVLPDAASAAVLFPNLLDLTRRAACAEAGESQGRALARTAQAWPVRPATPAAGPTVSPSI